MMDQYPYTNFHELNLDWIIQKVKEAYSPDNPPDNLVLSVNGQTGDVVLYQNANVMLPTVTENIWNIFRTSDSVATGIQFNKNGAMERINGTSRYQVYDQGNPPDYPVDSVNGQTGDVVLYPTEDVQFPSVEDGAWTIHRRIDGSNSGLLFIKNVKAQRIDGTNKYDIYDAGNPPPYPVTSVNGQTGAVTLTFPVTSVNGQTGAVVLTFPVTSVNGQTGDVVIPQLVNNVSADYLHITQDATGDEWAIERGITSGTTTLRIEVNNGHVEAYLDFTDTTDTVVDSFKLLTTQDIPSSAGVVSVNGSAGVVVLTGSDIAVSSDDNTTIATKLSNLQNSKANQDTLAFMEPGDTATQNIPAGRYVYWKGNMYKSSSAISQYDTLSLSNLTAVSPNALNDLQGQVTSLSDQIANFPGSNIVDITGTNAESATVYKIGKVVFLNIAPKTSALTGNGIMLAAIPNGYKAPSDMVAILVGSDNSGNMKGGNVIIRSNGNVEYYGVDISGVSFRADLKPFLYAFWRTA